jgi:hypothetical protein
VASLDADERKIASRLRKLVLDEIEQRNYVAHGDWWIDVARLGLAPVGTSQLLRIRPVRKEGVVEVRELTKDDMEGWSDSLVQLRGAVSDFGAVCLGFGTYHEREVRLKDIHVLRSGEVIRDGPRAAEFEPFG